jgi:hypothetical protein
LKKEVNSEFQFWVELKGITNFKIHFTLPNNVTSFNTLHIYDKFFFFSFLIIYCVSKVYPLKKTLFTVMDFASIYVLPHVPEMRILLKKMRPILKYFIIQTGKKAK